MCTYIYIYIYITTIVCLLTGQSVQPKDTPVTSEKHPNPSAGAVKTDGGRKKAGKEEKKNSFWKWPTLHFSFSRAVTYDLAKAEEKYEIETETLWGDSDGIHYHKNMSWWYKYW